MLNNLLFTDGAEPKFPHDFGLTLYNIAEIAGVNYGNVTIERLDGEVADDLGLPYDVNISIPLENVAIGVTDRVLNGSMPEQEAIFQHATLDYAERLSAVNRPRAISFTLYDEEKPLFAPYSRLHRAIRDALIGLRHIKTFGVDAYKQFVGTNTRLDSEETYTQVDLLSHRMLEPEAALAAHNKVISSIIGTMKDLYCKDGDYSSIDEFYERPEFNLAACFGSQFYALANFVNENDLDRLETHFAANFLVSTMVNRFNLVDSYLQRSLVRRVNATRESEDIAADLVAAYVDVLGDDSQDDILDFGVWSVIGSIGLNLKDVENSANVDIMEKLFTN